MLNLELMDLKSYCATAIAHPKEENLEYVTNKLIELREKYDV
ncbi:hypothetical protein [Aeromonas phage Akh-2]|nr:hypothetical protein [Aeromonas phage Akh-2]